VANAFAEPRMIDTINPATQEPVSPEQPPSSSSSSSN